MERITPLRYPGGKTKIYNQIEKIIDTNFTTLPVYVEPFCGGAGLALELLFNKKVDRLILNDYDPAVYSFWYCVLNKEEELINLISKVDVTIEEWKKQKEIYEDQNNHNILEIGFSFFFLNRCNRSGILKAGPIGGKNQDGKYKINCRYNKKNLIERIIKINSLKDRIELYNLDAIEFLKIIKQKNVNNTFIYMDPPYINKGHELYQNFYSNEKHKTIEESVKKYIESNKWIITYDYDERIKKIYSNYSLFSFNINYSAGKHKSGDELMIFSETTIVPEEIKNTFLKKETY